MQRASINANADLWNLGFTIFSCLSKLISQSGPFKTRDGPKNLSHQSNFAVEHFE
jgi:hypothetical protein